MELQDALWERSPLNIRQECPCFVYHGLTEGVPFTGPNPYYLAPCAEEWQAPSYPVGEAVGKTQYLSFCNKRRRFLKQFCSVQVPWGTFDR